MVNYFIEGFLVVFKEFKLLLVFKVGKNFKDFFLFLGKY